MLGAVQVFNVAGDSEQAQNFDSCSEHSQQSVDWHKLVAMIQAGEPAAMENLYALFSKGVRYYLCRQLGMQELEDKIHDTFLIVVQAIRRGELREPERLMGFVRTVMRRQVAAHIDSAVHKRREQIDLEPGVLMADVSKNPEQRAILEQKIALMEKVLLAVPRRDLLTRFYLNEQSQEEICSEMQLTETQFRLLKSRAKARFGEIGKRALTRKPVQHFFMRRAAVA